MSSEDELRELVEQWRRWSGPTDGDEWADGYNKSLKQCADELEEILDRFDSEDELPEGDSNE